MSQFLKTLVAAALLAAPAAAQQRPSFDFSIPNIKDDWELAVYPVEDHGFVRPDSWTDEYRLIFRLFERAIGPAREPRAANEGGRR